MVIDIMGITYYVYSISSPTNYDGNKQVNFILNDGVTWWAWDEDIW